MPHTALQIWGGAFYLLQKIFLSRAARSGEKTKDRWLHWSKIVYVIGIPAWLVIFSGKRDWMMVGIESSGILALILSAITKRYPAGRKQKWPHCVLGAIILVGFLYSCFDYGSNAGLLFGTYLIYRQKPAGYCWYMLMHLTTGALMAIQHLPWLALQQAASMAFVVDAYRVERRKALAKTPRSI